MTSASLHAQASGEDQPLPGYGVFGNFNLNMHTADFRALPGVPSCCPQYVNGDGTGFNLGLLFEIPFSTRLSLSLRGSYAAHGALLQSRETTTVSVGGSPTLAVIEHSLDAKLTSMGIEPLVGYRIFGGLRINAGGRLGFVIDKQYDQKEALIEPAGTGTFENGLRTRNVLSGEIPDASSLYAAVIAGVSYRLPLNREGTLFLVPEALYSYGIIPIVSGLSWNANALRAGVSIVYSSRPEEKVVQPPLPPPPPPPPAKPALSAAVAAVGVDKAGNETPVVNVVIEEFISTQFRPMLAYVFFDENMSELPSRYHRLTSGQSASFDVNDLHLAGMLDVHHHVLNIVGKRLRENPSATITVTGCNSNTGVESGNRDLSRSRAETVRDYLKKAWNIAEDRITVKARNLPARPSGSDEEDGIAENRRVELSSNTWEVLAPVVTRDFERQVTPSIVRFYPSVRTETGVRKWSLTVAQKREELKTFHGEGDLPRVLDWKMNLEQESIPRGPEPLEYVLYVTDKSGQRASAHGTVQLEQKKIDKEVGRYSLILFDFDQTTLNSYNRKISDMIRPTIDPGASVKITGYSDRIGEEEYNRKLSEERARNTARILGMRNAQVEGLGKSVLLYDNNLPEGRFYSRTVNILVEKEGEK